MRVSVSLTNYSWPGELTAGLLDVVRAADEAGIDTVWLPDHLVQADPNAAGDADMLEAYTALGFLAGKTARVRLGTMVTGVTFRPPALLVKAVTTVDVLSGGRAWLGIGAGYHAAEAEAMGLFLPPTAERFQRLEETLEIAHRMWAGDATPYEGRHYALGNPVNEPPAPTRPHPPVLIGGMGEKQHAAAGGPLRRRVQPVRHPRRRHDDPPQARRAAPALRRRRPALRRHRQDGEHPLHARRVAAPRLDALAALGIEHAVFVTGRPWTPDGIAALSP